MPVTLPKSLAPKLALASLLVAVSLVAACGGNAPTEGVSGGDSETIGSTANGSTKGEPTKAPPPPQPPDDGPSPPPSESGVPGVLFPRHETPVGGPMPQAATTGYLVVDEAGCLRLTYSGSYNNVLVWPPDYSLKAAGGEVLVLNEEGETVARVGDKVHLGGGEVGTSLEGIEALSERTRRELQESCPGSYWLVSEVIMDRR